MEIHLLVQGEQVGPFSEAQVREYLGEGLVSFSDLASHDGLEDWLPLEQLLATLSPADAAPKTISEDVPASEPSDAGVEPLEQEELPFLIMPDNTFEPAEPPSGQLQPDPAILQNRPQKLKRKPNKIVIQPILPLEATAPAKKKSRTGKTTLTLEPLRPTTSLPPVTGHLPPVRKLEQEVNRTGQESHNDLPEKPVAPVLASPPPVAAPPEPVEPVELTPPPAAPLKLPPPEILTKASVRPVQSWKIPNVILYPCVGVILVVACMIFFWLYLVFSNTGTPANAENAPPEPVQAIIQMPPQMHSIEAAPNTAPTTATDFSDRGFDKQNQGDLAGAVADYNQALSLDPKNSEAYFRRGLARQAQGDLNDAVADYTQVLTLDPKRADAFSNRGFIKQAQGDVDGALADYNQALVITPKIPRAYYNVGLIKVQKGDLDGAIAAYDQALELDPKMSFAYYNRGVAKNAEGNVDGAIADFTQALILNPKLAQAYCDRGIDRQSKGDGDGALSDFAQALDLNPKLAAAYFNRALIRSQRGDLDGAIADNTQAIELNPANAQAYYNRGMGLMGKGSLDDALTDLNKFCELAPRDGNADSARVYIWLISTEKDPDGDADEKLASALLNDWNSPPEDLTSKIAAFLVGHITEKELIANAASPDPSREPGQYCRVWYFAGMKRLIGGDMTTAITYFQKSVATQQKDLSEYLFAQTELHALGQNSEIASKPVMQLR